MRQQLSERPTVLYFELGGTLGIAIIYISKPPFLSSANHPARLLEMLLIWWLISFIGALIMGQLKIAGQKTDEEKDT